MLRKLDGALTEYKQPQDVTIDKLSKDHAEMWNELIANTNASAVDILIIAKAVVLSNQLKEENSSELSLGAYNENVVNKMQQEVCIAGIVALTLCNRTKTLMTIFLALHLSYAT